MAIWHIEKLGGLANFGGTRSRIRSRGQFDTSSVPATEQKALEALFHESAKVDKAGAADGFRYRITRSTPGGTETIEVPEAKPAPRRRAKSRQHVAALSG